MDLPVNDRRIVEPGPALRPGVLAARRDRPVVLRAKRWTTARTSLTVREHPRMAKRIPPNRRRTQWTQADAKRVLDEWQRSGDTLEAFARARGLVPQRIVWWRKRLALLRSTRTTALTLVPATVISAEPVAALRLPGDVVLELSSVSPSWIAALARELARPQS